MTSCHGCTEQFGFWRKNVGCPKCGFSYCQKCIRFKLNLDGSEISGKGNTQVVCQICYSEAQVLPQAKQSAEGIESIQKENVGKAMEVLEMMDDPGKPPITLYRESNRVAALKRGLSIEDQKIVDRLQELRGDSRRRKSDNIGEGEVAARLAKLKDQPYNPESTAASSILTKSKPETEDDLVARLAREVCLDKNYEDTLVGDIEQRLLKLKEREVPPSPAEQMKPSVSLDTGETKTEEEQVEEIMQRYIAEAALPKTEAKPPKQSESDEEEGEGGGSSADDDDLDYDHLCRICEVKRATLKCLECDDDIFCSRCFTEFHEELGECHSPMKILSSREPS